MANLKMVEGIGEGYAQKLQEAGVTSVEDFLAQGATRKGRQTIAEKSGITGALILRWVNHVDLYRVKGVGEEYADLLEAAGVDSVPELAQRNPENLHQKLAAVNDEKSRVRKIPSLSQVTEWIEHAKRLPRVVEY